MKNSYSVEEDNFQELLTAFNLFDKDRDGKISKDEMIKAFRDLGHVCTDEDIYEIFKQFECKDGIDYKIFEEIATQKRFSRGKLDTDLKEAFKIFDRENMNYIATEDLKFILANYCNTLTNHEVNAMIKEIDANGDGNVSFEEFINMIMMK